MLTTDLSDHLVRKGVPFREAHHVAGAVVKMAEQRCQPRPRSARAPGPDALGRWMLTALCAWQGLHPGQALCGRPPHPAPALRRRCGASISPALSANFRLSMHMISASPFLWFEFPRGVMSPVSAGQVWPRRHVGLRGGGGATAGAGRHLAGRHRRPDCRAPRLARRGLRSVAARCGARAWMRSVRVQGVRFFRCFELIFGHGRCGSCAD